MANVDRPNGFKPVKHLNGNPWNGKTRKYACPLSETTAIGIGDMVLLSTKPILAGTDGVPGIESIGTGAVTSGNLVGCVVGFVVVNPTGGVSGGASPGLDTPQYKAASAALKYALVCDDPDVLFEAQADDAGIDLTDIGANCAITSAGANTVTGMSTQEIDGSSGAVTAALPLTIMEAVNRPNNQYVADGAATGVAFARFLVKINNHQYRSLGLVTPTRD
jgi:hypothetical protein